MTVGVFDSGLGGLSVWHEIQRALPATPTVYVADQAHIPWGSRAASEILVFSLEVTRFLVDQGCGVIVAACHTASAAALQKMRHEFPNQQFVGMEPAVKPAVAASTTGVVGVLATPTTLEGELFAATRRRWASRARVVAQPCPGLVEQIERGEVDGPTIETMLRVFLEAPLLAGADVLVLACSHYPFVRAPIESLAGAGVRVVDPAPAIARQVQRIAGGDASAGDTSARHRFYTTGDPLAFERVASKLLGRRIAGRSLRWNADASKLSAPGN